MTKRKNNNTLLYILGGVILALIVFAIFKAKNRPQGEKVTVEAVAARTINEKVSASGKVFPVVEVKISSDVSGEIVELYVQEGDSVVAGQVLARIDPDAYQSQVERGVAGVNSSKAQVANSKSQIENLRAQREQIVAQLENAREIQNRNSKLFKDGVISEADYQASLSSLRSLEANLRSADAGIKAAQESARAAEFTVASAEASLKELRTSLRRTTVYAPSGGIISLLNVEKGERVVGTIQMTGTEMMRIANLNSMEVRVDVSESDIPRVSLNDPVEIEVDAYLGRKFKGRVTQIANTASNAAGAASLTSDQITNFEVRINIDPASYSDLISPKKRYPFRPGMSASVDILTQSKEGVLSVPIQAVTTREKEGVKKKFVESKDGETAEKSTSTEDLLEVVFVAMEGDTVRMAEVKTGIQDDNFIEIVSGLKAGETIISGPYSVISRKLKSGEKIQRVTEDELFGSKDKKKED
ncbi:MAG: efflux RND transporter periplasmic adaptor subunit [Lewinellaceae bacterium]|nr:efflux RND transporter periplasmic adaptor subunit [Lewinellaceae bacterium]